MCCLIPHRSHEAVTEDQMMRVDLPQFAADNPIVGVGDVIHEHLIVRVRMFLLKFLQCRASACAFRQRAEEFHVARPRLWLRRPDWQVNEHIA